MDFNDKQKRVLSKMFSTDVSWHFRNVDFVDSEGKDYIESSEKYYSGYDLGQVKSDVKKHCFKKYFSLSNINDIRVSSIIIRILSLFKDFEYKIDDNNDSRHVEYRLFLKGKRTSSMMLDGDYKIASALVGEILFSNEDYCKDSSPRTINKDIRMPVEYSYNGNDAICKSIPLLTDTCNQIVQKLRNNE